MLRLSNLQSSIVRIFHCSRYVSQKDYRKTVFELPLISISFSVKIASFYMIWFYVENYLVDNKFILDIVGERGTDG